MKTITGTVTAAGLNLRVAARPNSPWRDKLSKGDRFEVIDRRAGWLYVRVKRSGQCGWVYSEYVAIDRPVPDVPDVPSFDPGPDVTGLVRAAWIAGIGIAAAIGLATCIGP